MTNRPTLLLCAAVFASLGCGPETTPACIEGAPPDAPTSLALFDAAADDWALLEDGATVEVVQGLQGGYMVLLGVRLTGPDAERPRCVEIALDVSGLDEDVATYTSTEPLDPMMDTEDVGPYPMLPSFDLASLTGRAVTFAAFADDGGLGSEVSVSVSLVDEQ